MLDKHLLRLLMWDHVGATGQHKHSEPVYGDGTVSTPPRAPSADSQHQTVLLLALHAAKGPNAAQSLVVSFS